MSAASPTYGAKITLKRREVSRMARQFIYHMHGMSKAYAGGKKVLDNIHLSFYPDAKIGVLGPNGSGKSTLLRIMAGIDSDFTGEAWLAEGAKVGYLPQEPQLDPALNVLGNVMTGVKEKKDILDRYNELMLNYSDETADEATKLQDAIDAQNLWDLESQVEVAMEALGCPPGDADVTNLSGGESGGGRDRTGRSDGHRAGLLVGGRRIVRPELT
jgi:ATPase subunit of ABC transporter with duplicated ATPase domains